MPGLEVKLSRLQRAADGAAVLRAGIELQQSEVGAVGGSFVVLIPAGGRAGRQVSAALAVAGYRRAMPRQAYGMARLSKLHSRDHVHCSQGIIAARLLVAQPPQPAPQLWLQHAARRIHTKGCCEGQARRQERRPCVCGGGRWQWGNYRQGRGLPGFHHSLARLTTCASCPHHKCAWWCCGVAGSSSKGTW